MVSRWNIKFMTSLIDEIASSRKAKLTKWQVGETGSWWIGNLIKNSVDKMLGSYCGSDQNRRERK